MNLISGLKNSIAFLTIFPVGMNANGIAEAASYMPLFPVIGAMVGLMAGIVVWLLRLILPQILSAVIGTGLLILINGGQHLDGLLDFGDGVMFHGSRTGKLRVMRDPTTGAGGFALGSIILLVTVFAIAAVPSGVVVPTLTAAEASALFAMVLATAAGRSAHKGMNTIFVEAMHHRRPLRLIISAIIPVAVSLTALGPTGSIVIAGAVFTALFLVALSMRNFGGITGDVLGATNEIVRAVSLLLTLVFLKWA